MLSSSRRSSDSSRSRQGAYVFARRAVAGEIHVPSLQEKGKSSDASVACSCQEQRRGGPAADRNPPELEAVGQRGGGAKGRWGDEACWEWWPARALRQNIQHSTLNIQHPRADEDNRRREDYRGGCADATLDVPTFRRMLNVDRASRNSRHPARCLIDSLGSVSAPRAPIPCSTPRPQVMKHWRFAGRGLPDKRKTPLTRLQSVTG